MSGSNSVPLESRSSVSAFAWMTGRYDGSRIGVRFAVEVGVRCWNSDVVSGQFVGDDGGTTVAGTAVPVVTKVA